MSAESRAYARGYQSAKRNYWPHEMPNPPEPVICRLIEAVARIRNHADGLRATFDPDDEVVKVFDGLIDEADGACRAVKNWMSDELAKRGRGGD